MSVLLGIAIVVGAAVLSAVVVLLSIRTARRIDFVDRPDEERKVQAVPIPKLGGVAVALTFTIAVIVGLIVAGRAVDLGLALTVLVPALGLALVGFLDDRRGLDPYVRLLLQAVFAYMAWDMGTRMVVTTIPWLDAVGFILWVVLIVNGVNLLDNSDGLAASTVLVSATGAAIIAAIFGQELVWVLALALVGVAAGFLVHNWFPARVYMGDSGAYFLGFLLAVLTVRLRPAEASAAEGVAIAVLLVLLPLVDTAYVVVKRLRRGVHPFTAGRDHLSHVLQGAGLSVSSSVLVLQGLLLLSVGGAVAIAALAS